MPKLHVRTLFKLGYAAMRSIKSDVVACFACVCIYPTIFDSGDDVPPWSAAHRNGGDGKGGGGKSELAVDVAVSFAPFVPSPKLVYSGGCLASVFSCVPSRSTW